VFLLERDAVLATVRALPAPLLQQVLAKLTLVEFALLVIDAVDGRVL
jgi:hypothetical protein